MARLAQLVLADVRLREGPGAAPLLTATRLELAAGRLYGLIGTNGSGRSALLRLVGGGFVGSAELSEGASRRLVRSDGQTADLLSRREAVYLGPNPQDSVSTLTATVAEELAFHEALRDEAVAVAGGPDAEALAGRLGLSDCMEQDPMELSGGQTAALVVACALLMGRPILCIDETLAQLDVVLRAVAWRLMKDHTGRGGLILVADNQYDLMAEFADQFVLLREGRAEACLGLEAFARQDVLAQGTLAPVMRLAAELGGWGPEVPVRYEQLLDALRRRRP